MKLNKHPRQLLFHHTLSKKHNNSLSKQHEVKALFDKESIHKIMNNRVDKRKERQKNESYS